MPTLPQYNSQRSLSTRAPAPVENASQISTKPLELLGTMTQDWQKAVDTMQLTTAKTEYEVKSQKIINRAKLDPDHNNSASYFSELAKAKEDSLKGFSNKELQKAYALELDRDNRLEMLKVDNIFKNKMLDFSIGELEKGVNVLMDKAIEGDFKAAEDMVAMIDANVANGVIDPKAGEKLKQKTLKDIRTGRIEQAIWNDPKGALKVIEKDDSLTAKEKLQYTGQANSRVKAIEDQEKWQTQMTYSGGALKASEALLSNSLNPKDIKDMVRAGEMDASTASIFYKAVNKKPFTPPDKTDLTKPDFLLSLLDDTLDDKTKALDVLKKATESYSKKEMGYNQYAYFISEAQKKLEAEKKGETWGDKMVRSLLNPIRNSVGIPPLAIYNIVNGFIDRVQKEKPGKEGAEAILVDEIYKQHDLSEKDKFGFILGEEKNGYTYIGDNRWQK